MFKDGFSESSVSSGQSLHTAFVLAAGKGERLRPLTLNTPKPLISVKGKPILEHILRQLERMGFKRVVLNAWYLRDQIENYVNQSNSRFSFELLLSMEEELLGTGGGLKQALPLIGSAPFLMLNGDSLWDLDEAGFWKKWNEQPSSNVHADWFLISSQEGQTSIGWRGESLHSIGDLWRDVGAAEGEGCFSGLQIFHQIEPKRLPDKGCIIRDYHIPLLRQGSQIRVRRDLFTDWEDLGTPERLQAYEQSH